MEYVVDLAEEVIAKIRSGELEVQGLEIRDKRKIIRYVVKGFEKIQTNSLGQPEHPQLQLLQSAMSVQQILGMAAIAQNAALATSLKRVEAKLDAINERLATMENQLRSISTEIAMTREAVFREPLAKLSAARSAMAHAIRLNDIPSKVAAVKDIEESGALLLSRAEILVRQRQNNVPAFMHGRTTELRELVSGAAQAFLIASDLHVQLKGPEIASRIAREISSRIKKLIQEIKDFLMNDDWLPYRAAAQLDSDEMVVELGKLMTRTLHETTGRAMFIELGLYNHEAGVDDSETVDQGISFIPVPSSLTI